MNPKKIQEIQTQVQELLDKGYVLESIPPCVVPVLLVHKKDNIWSMCVDCRAINNKTIKYRHPITRLDDMLDELHEATIFTKIDLRSGYLKFCGRGWSPGISESSTVAAHLYAAVAVSSQKLVFSPQLICGRTKGERCRGSSRYFSYTLPSSIM